MTCRPSENLPVRGVPFPMSDDDHHAPRLSQSRWLTIACARDANAAEIVAAKVAVMLDCIGHMQGAQRLAKAGAAPAAIKYRVEKGMVADQLARRIGEALE